jgi:hypothetical protein
MNCNQQFYDNLGFVQSAANQQQIQVTVAGSAAPAGTLQDGPAGPILD